LGDRIGGGSFGEIFEGIERHTGKQVAVKVESQTSHNPQLRFEAKVYKHLAGGRGIAQMHWYGSCPGHALLVIDRLGPSLEDLFNRCGRKFSLKTVLMIADQLIDRLEYIHTCHLLHRDIKPHNFLIGRGSTERTIYAIDFGLAKKYWSSTTKSHISYRVGKSLTGTARYASLNTHNGIEQGRRDDMEALGFMLVYFLRGTLPWQGLKLENKDEKYNRIAQMKAEISPYQLCKGLPVEFMLYFDHVRSLLFDERPNYAYLKGLLFDVFEKEGYRRDDAEFDWARTRRRVPEAARAQRHTSIGGVPPICHASPPAVPESNSVEDKPRSRAPPTGLRTTGTKREAKPPRVKGSKRDREAAKGDKEVPGPKEGKVTATGRTARTHTSAGSGTAAGTSAGAARRSEGGKTKPNHARLEGRGTEGLSLLSEARMKPSDVRNTARMEVQNGKQPDAAPTPRCGAGSRRLVRPHGSAEPLSKEADRFSGEGVMTRSRSRAYEATNSAKLQVRASVRLADDAPLPEKPTKRRRKRASEQPG